MQMLVLAADCAAMGPVSIPKNLILTVPINALCSSDARLLLLIRFSNISTIKFRCQHKHKKETILTVAENMWAVQVSADAELELHSSFRVMWHRHEVDF